MRVTDWKSWLTFTLAAAVNNASESTPAQYEIETQNAIAH